MDPEWATLMTITAQNIRELADCVVNFTTNSKGSDYRQNSRPTTKVGLACNKASILSDFSAARSCEAIF